MTTTIDTWVMPTLAKHSPDAIRVLMDLIEAGLKRGECSALDIRDLHFDQPNVIGATMKTLRRLGFVHTDRRATSTIKRKHGRRVDVWELAERWKAERFLTSCRVQLLLITDSGPRQRVLAI